MVPAGVAIRLLAVTPGRMAAGLGHSMLGQTAPGQATQPLGTDAASPPPGSVANGPIRTEDYSGPIRVACVGDSITAGAGTSNNALFSYPAQLQRMLGDKWDVRNFGVSGRTLLNAGDYPYQAEDAFKTALSFQPNVVVIMLGTNDTKPQNWAFKANFAADYLSLIRKFRNIASVPRIFLCLPIPCFGEGNYGINEAGIDEELPLIRKLAVAQQLDAIDMHTPFAGQDALLPDRVHPNNEGAALMARTVYKALTGREYVGPPVLSLRSLAIKRFRLT